MTLRCTSLSVFGGVATAESTAGGVLGGAAGWQISPRFALEGNAFWLDRPGSETGFSAALNSHVNLVRRHTAVPFLTAGIGVYPINTDRQGEGRRRRYIHGRRNIRCRRHALGHSPNSSPEPGRSGNFKPKCW